MKPVLLIVGNDAKYFISHRLPVAECARAHGYEVCIATPDGPSVSEIEGHGFKHHKVFLSRSGTNPFTELKALMSLWRLCWRLRPDILHLVTIKPVIYGGIAARLSPVKGVLAAVPGLGFIFTASGVRATLLRGVISLLYRLALRKRNLLAVFQNPDDRNTLVNIGAVTHEKCVLIRGSGVDLKQYQAVPEGSGLPVVTFAARLLRDKGVIEFVEASRILALRGVEAKFQLVGDPDPGNPTSVSPDDVARWLEEGVVQCLGYQSDMPTILSRSHVVALPSYREGLPRVLVEAAACGRAVVTTDVPGCRDAIERDVTGLLVPMRDASALADAIQNLIDNPISRREMGQAGRKLAEREFAIESIAAQHLKIYRKLRGVS